MTTSHLETTTNPTMWEPEVELTREVARPSRERQRKITKIENEAERELESKSNGDVTLKYISMSADAVNGR